MAELITPQAMGGLVATLEEAGYVARCHDAEDARRRLVTLTAVGRKVLVRQPRGTTLLGREPAGGAIRRRGATHARRRARAALGAVPSPELTNTTITCTY